QRESDLPLACHLVYRRLTRGLQPRIRYALAARFGNDLGRMRVQEHVELRLVQVLLAGAGGGRLDAVRVVQQDAQIADAAHAGFGTDGRLAGLDARITERAFLGLAALPVVIHLLVRAARDAHAPAAALVLVNQHDAVVFALVDGTRRAAGHAGGVQAVFAQARQVHHERVLEGRVHFFLYALEQRVAAARTEFAAQVIFPVRAPVDLVHLAAGQHRHRPGRRRG